MKNLLLYPTLLLLVLLQSCQKEESFELLKGTSKYDFMSPSGDCASATISGNWEAGKQLDEMNVVTITANVKEKGTWSYQQTINGITLSGSGNFADTGYTVVTLKATGTPAKEGISNFVLSATAGCGIEITVAPNQGTTPGGTLDGPFYYKATIGGTYFEALTKKAPSSPNDYWTGSGMGGLQDVSFSSDISPMSVPPPTGTTSIEISKRTLFNYYSATNATVKNFLAPGTYPYVSADSANLPNTNGISILWTDKDGNYWGTEFGKADQTGSSFKIISEEEYNDPTVLYSLKVKMQFTCKLYKEDTGEMKQLTNGEMVGLFARLR